MATGHPLAGYGNYVNHVQRAASAHPIGSKDVESKYAAMEKNVLDEIKRKAFNEWSRPNRSATTYDHFHGEKSIYEAAQNRPTSPTRLNKPHPPLIFLTNRLHHIDGFFNPDATMGREAYQVDGSLQPQAQAQRDIYRSKYDGRPRTAAVIQQTSNLQQLKQQMGPWEAQATDAWMRVANDEDRREMEEDLAMRPSESPVCGSPIAPMASAHRFMKQAGAQEGNRIRKIMGAKEYTFNPGRVSGAPLPSTLVTQMQGGAPGRTRRKPVYQYRPTRGDFLLHPDWPPTLEGHGLPDWPERQPERQRYVYHRRKLIAV